MNIGLVLSGGMAKGAYQIGVLNALKEFLPFEEIKYISCASVGVLNGYAYAVDKLDIAEQMWKRLCTADERLIIGQVLKSNLLQQNIAKLCECAKDISLPFFCSLFDFTNRSVVYKDISTVSKDRILDYLKASVAMPVYNRSIKIDGRTFYDGAMVDNIPVYPLLKYSLDYIICVYFDDTCYKFESSYFDNKIIKITFPCDDNFKQSLIFKQENIEFMIKNGYERTEFVLRSVFSKGYDDLEYIYKMIYYINSNVKNGKTRITGDMLVSNLNKIAQRLTKRKIL